MTWTRLSKLALIVLSFVAAGPLIGLVVLAIGGGILAFGVSIEEVQSRLDNSASTVLVVLLYGHFFAHWIGALAACIAGVLVAWYASWRGSVPLGVGVIVALSASLAVTRAWDRCRGTISVRD